MTTSGDDLAPPPDPAGPPDPPDPPGPPDPPDPSEPPSSPAPPPPGPSAPAGRRRGLVRSTDRYVGGVAGGIAQGLDVDPIVVRLVLVVGTLYLPVLIVLYALAWLVLPDERTGATLLGSAGSPDGWRPVAGVAGLGLGAALVVPELGPGGDGALTFGVVLAGIGLLLVLRHPAGTASGPPVSGWPDPSEPPVGPASPDPDEPPLDTTWGDPEHPPEDGSAPPAAPPLERLVRRRFDQVHRRRPPSPLGWLGLSALVVLAGVLAAVDRGIEPVKPGVAVSLGLLLVGAVLLVAAWRGRARLLVLPGLALLPLWVGFGLSDVPRYDGDGDLSYVPETVDELRRAYEHGYGQLDVDLREVRFRPDEHREIRIGLTAGRARLYVPAAAHLVIRGDFGIGNVEVDENPYFGQVAGSGRVVGRIDELRLGDPQPVCAKQDVYGPDSYDELGNYVPGEVVGTEHRTPWGEPCEPEPPVDDPPVLELTLDVGIGTVEVHREAA